jgi:hypothetical protein
VRCHNCNVCWVTFVGAFFGPQRKVQLLSPDKQTFEVEWDVAMRSTVVKQMLEGQCVSLSLSLLLLCRPSHPVDLVGAAVAVSPAGLLAVS